jgi:hypothetical protein
MHWFQPFSLEELQKFEFLGLLMALAIYNGVPVPLHFPIVFYNILLGYPYSFGTMKDGWPTRDGNLKGENLHDFDLDFSFSFEANGSTYSSDMISRINDDIYASPELLKDSSAPSVTAEKEVQDVYRRYDTFWRVEKSVLPQLSAFQKGFRSLFPRDILKPLTPLALKLMATGIMKISLRGLIQGTRYKDYLGTEPFIKWFWETLDDFTEEESKKFLAFLTGNEYLPIVTGHAPLMTISKPSPELADPQNVSFR